MQAIRLHAPDGPEALVVEEVETPRVGEGEALVRVHAAAITRDELDWPVDRLPAIPSYELSGEVVEGQSAGAAVYALTPFDRDGAAAEYVVVPEALLAPKPSTLGHVESAALPMPALSAWQGLFTHGRLEPAQRVLVIGANGGVGHLAVQLARHAGAEVLTDLDDTDEAVDLVFDTAGGDVLSQCGASRVVSVAEQPPGDGIFFVVEPNRAQLVELSQLADRGELRPEIDSTFALADARAAFERTMARGKHGKVVLLVVDG
jgi:NADPH:quinone reductase-like Zn-dependent oxidoreductase